MHGSKVKRFNYSGPTPTAYTKLCDLSRLGMDSGKITVLLL